MSKPDWAAIETAFPAPRLTDSVQRGYFTLRERRHNHRASKVPAGLHPHTVSEMIMFTLFILLSIWLCRLPETPG